MKIRKPRQAQTNTFVAEMKGMSVNPSTLKGQHVNVQAMFTSDAAGETLSLFDPTTKKQIVVAFEDVMQLVDYARQNREAQV